MRFALLGTHSPSWIGRPRERGALAAAKAQEMGLSVELSCYTQGEFDFVTILESPDSETASRFSIWYCAQGFGRARTMRVYSADEIALICDPLSGRSGAHSGHVDSVPGTSNSLCDDFEAMLRLPVFGDLDQASLDEQYNPRAKVADFAAIVERWQAQSSQARRELACTSDVAYGASVSEKLDIFHAGRKHAPIQIFFHGGYWRAMNKNDFSFVARDFVAAGATVVVVDYALCPTVTLDELVGQCYDAIRWISAHAKEIGGDPDRVFLSGHSAGGHITAMGMTADEGHIPAGLIKGGCSVSGLFSLEPLRRSFLNAEIRLDQAGVRRNSPIRLVGSNCAPLIASVGDLESREYHRQTEAFLHVWRARGNQAKVVQAPGLHHYAVLEAFCDAAHPLGQAVLAQMGLA